MQSHEFDPLIKTFSEAYLTLLNVSRNYIDSALEEQFEKLENVILLLERIKRHNKYVHVIGMGRSRLAGKVIAEVLKIKGLRVSMIGDTLSKPVQKDDVIIAVSASGWTNTTCYVVEEGIRLGAKIVSFTATPGSKLDRLSDISIYLPGKSRINGSSYILRRMHDERKTPLAPMGTIPEINSILIGVSLALAVNTMEPLKTIKKVSDLIVENAFISYDMMLTKSKEDLISTIKELSKFIDSQGRKIYFGGAGISEIIGLMSASRFQHLGLNVLSMEDWKFREKDDILLIISSSGESAIPLLYAKEAKRTNLQLVHITSKDDSSIAKLADKKIVIRDITPNRIEYLEYQVMEKQGNEIPFVPAFEFTALLTLESIVAQIASIHGILEDQMRSRHANIE